MKRILQLIVLVVGVCAAGAVAVFVALRGSHTEVLTAPEPAAPAVPPPAIQTWNTEIIPTEEVAVERKKLLDFVAWFDSPDAVVTARKGRPKDCEKDGICVAWRSGEPAYSLDYAKGDTAKRLAVLSAGPVVMTCEDLGGTRARAWQIGEVRRQTCARRNGGGVLIAMRRASSPMTKIVVWTATYLEADADMRQTVEREGR